MHKLITALFLLLGMIYSAVIHAKEINLYEAPENKAKIVGKVDLSVGVIPIYSQKTGDWMKVGDPRNGNVGWIKSNEIGQSGSQSFTFTQRIIDDGQGKNTYQIIQYGKPQDSSGEEMQSIMQRMQTRQQVIQKEVQNAIQNMVKELNTLYQTQSNKIGQMPVIMPIVIIPSEKPVTEPTTKQGKQ